jgi:hypothetical protein
MAFKEWLKNNIQYLAVVIQTCFLVFVALTFWCQKNFNEEQLRLNNNALRPWVYVTVDSGCFLDINEDGQVRVSQWVSNIGGTPACSVKTRTYIDFDPTFPEEAISQLMKNDTNPRAPFIFPGQKPVRIISLPMSITKYDSLIVQPLVPTPTETLIRNDTTILRIINPRSFPVILETLSLKQDTVKSRDEVFDIFADSSFHIHTYIKYNDAQNNHYFLKNTFFAKCKATTDTSMTIEIYGTYNSEEPID